MKQTQGNQRQAILLSYLAGIIDGEGSICIRKLYGSRSLKKMKLAHPRYSATLSLGMITKQIPDLLQTTLGGSVREECVPDRRSIWRWAMTSRKQVSRALKSLLPYLIVKKQHAQTVINYCDQHIECRFNQYAGSQKPIYYQELQRREDAYRKMRKLNAVGAAAETNRESGREAEVIVRSCPKGQEVGRNAYPPHLRS